MEPNEATAGGGGGGGGLTSYYHQQQQPSQANPTTAAGTNVVGTIASPTNGILPPTSNTATGAGNSNVVYSHSVVPSAVSSPLETVKRKRGRPRKYGTPEQAAAAKRLATAAAASASTSSIAPPKKKHQEWAAAAAAASAGSGPSSSSKKSQLAALGNAGQGFTPHIVNVAAGEDVGQKIMMFMQQSKRELCILSASGSISNASLRQPATSGGNVTYEGRFDILSLSGSYIRTELGGRTGGLSVCLSSSDGQIIGGGVGGPLTAAGPIQVIVGTFQMDAKKDMSSGVRGDGSGSKLSSPIGGTSISGTGFPTHQNIGGYQVMMQPRGMQLTSSQSTEWRPGTGHGLHQSPENGDYEHLQD